MENKEILECNKMIAEFDGWSIENSFPDSNRTYVKNGAVELDTTFKYHTLWDWLMPVVEKIERMDNELFTVIITNDLCEITQFVNTDADLLKCSEAMVVSKLTDSKITSTFKAVVEFIKWYNEKKDNGKV